MANLEKENGVSKTRNSLIRQRTDWLTHNTALIIHEIFPSLTPNELTTLGVIEDLAGVCLAEWNNLSRSPSRMINGFSLLVEIDGELKDAFDGPLARIIMAQSPGKHDSSWGQVYDPLADRTKEIVAALLRAHTAYIKGSSLGERAALGVAITTTLPSLARAYDESLGYVVPEMGINILQAAGSTFGRIILNKAATHMRSVNLFQREILLQPSIDLLAATANIYNASARMNVITNPNAKPILGNTERQEAERRYKALMATELISIVAALSAYKMFRMLEPRPEVSGALIIADI